MNSHPLQYYENQIKQKISGSDIPFLGLLIDSINDQIIERLKDILHKGRNPIQVFCIELIESPALFSMYIIYHLAKEFGIRGHFEVYPILNKTFPKNLTNKDKELLWKAFRRACLRLGLSVSPRTSGTHYMVDEYLRQVGVPLQYIEELTRKMISFGRKVGYPEGDDPDSIQLWRRGLIENLNPPFPKTAKNAFEMDEAGYYVLLFLKVLISQKDIESSQSEIERRMVVAISYAAAETLKRQRLQIPRIIFQDFKVSILLPPVRI